jgi:NAD(P)H-nitrite reductase large subunit
MLEDGDRGVILQRDKQTYAVTPHIPCGLLTPELLRGLADAIERSGARVAKITSGERVALIGLEEGQIDGFWAELGLPPGFAVGQRVRNIRSCVGLPHCVRAQQDSLTVALQLDRRYIGRELPGKLKMAVSGCSNQCAESAVRDIGLVGMPKKGWNLLLGGCVGARPRIGELYCKGLSDDEALALIDRVMVLFEAEAKPKERLGRLIDRLGGLEAFREKLEA